MLGTDAYPGKRCLYYGVFQESGLEHVGLPSTLRRIERSTFESCYGLRGIQLPERLEYIGIECFSHSCLEEVAFPAGLKEVGANAFCDCRELKSVQLNEGLEKLGAMEVVGERIYQGLVFADSGVKSIRLPSTLKRVEIGTFYSCHRLERVEVSNGTEYIGSQCFCYS